jgi:hypothetical protein
LNAGACGTGSEAAAGVRFAVLTAFFQLPMNLQRTAECRQRKGKTMRKHIETEAIEALRDTLRQVSVIKVKDISADQHGHRSEILGHIEIYGHAHLLACKVVKDCAPPSLKRAIRDLRGVQKERGVVVLPVVIAPIISDEAQAVCRENNTGFLDLAGNARLYLDEVFIVKRSLPHHKELPSKAEKLPTSETAHFAQVA